MLETNSYKQETEEITTLLRTGATRYNDIKQELLDNYEQIAGSPDSSALVMEFAETWLPVYYSEILIEWGKMPFAFTDSWQEVYSQTEKGIFELMTFDLATWYCDMAGEAWNEIVEEKEAN
jgi:hypothetical protein